MHNRLVSSHPNPFLLRPLHLPPMRPLKHPITRNMIPLPLHILLHPPQHLPVRDARPLQQRRQILPAKMPIWTPMRLPGARLPFRQNFLATIRRIASPPAIAIAPDVAVRVPDVVAILLVEGVVGDEAEGGAPEAQALVERQADALQEEGVLEAAVVFEVGVGAEREVEVLHAEREVCGEGVDGGGGDGGAGEGAVGVGEGRVRGLEGFGEVGEDGG